MSKSESAELILKLYDLRREPVMRKARDWMFTFHPESAEHYSATMMDPEVGANHPDRNCLISVLMGTRIPKIDCPARPVQDLSGELSSRELLPMGMIYPGNPLRKSLSGRDFDTYEYLFDVLRPLTVLDVRGSRFQTQVATELGPARVLSEATFWSDLQQRHRRQTYLVPPNYTDDPEPDLSDDITVRAKLSTSILRYLHNGNDRAHCKVELRDERADRASTIHLRVLSTTFRGARQHWGRRSDREAITDPMGNRLVLGDHYE